MGNRQDWPDLWIWTEKSLRCSQHNFGPHATTCILTVDVGTSSTKTSLWTEAGQLMVHDSMNYA